MDRYVCQCCGGVIDRHTMKCEYCGTTYKADYETQRLYVETYTNPVRTLRVGATLRSEDLHLLGEQKATEVLTHRLQEQLAESLLPLMRYETTFDPEYRQYKIYGDLKAVVPINNGGGINYGRF